MKKSDQPLDSVNQSVREQNAAFAAALAASNAAGVANCYATDAEFMAPGAPAIVGRDKIEATMQGYIDAGFTNYKVLSTTVYGSTEIIGVQSSYTLSKLNGENKDVGKTIQLWKQENGEWRIFRDCFNSDLANEA